VAVAAIEAFRSVLTTRETSSIIAWATLAVMVAMVVTAVWC
jgi:hypothetical protein